MPSVVPGGDARYAAIPLIPPYRMRICRDENEAIKPVQSRRGKEAGRGNVHFRHASWEEGEATIPGGQ